jgi:predicted Zn-dependent peptidase
VTLFVALWIWAGLGPLVSSSQDLLQQFEDRVTTFTLDNGLTFVVIERPEAPVVSFHTYADVGSVDEPSGATGIAHMFEHMAFKGTTRIGTQNIEQEMAAINEMESIYQELLRAKAVPQPDSARIASLQSEFEAAQEEAESYIDAGAFDGLLEREGASGLNAFTSADATGYLYSLPANKIELFFATESERFLYPVFREFYTERDVVMEERRQRTESNPTGRLLEEFIAAAFKAHPYGEPVIGHMSDLETLSITEAEAFFDEYYQANNLTIAMAGDVDPAEARDLAEQYFSRLPAGEPPLPVMTEEPEQPGERRVTLVEQSQPFVLIGYHRPSMHSPDAPVYRVLQDVLTQGRTSRLYQSMVDTGEALQVQSIPSFPGSKYPTLFALVGVPNRDVSPDSIEQSIYSELDRLIEEGITSEELERAKTRVRANLVRRLDSNMGLARQFAAMQALTGDWRTVFEDVQDVEDVTVDDVQRVAEETFTRSNRTVGMIKSADDVNANSDGNSDAATSSTASGAASD